MTQTNLVTVNAPSGSFTGKIIFIGTSMTEVENLSTGKRTFYDNNLIESYYEDTDSLNGVIQYNHSPLDIEACLDILDNDPATVEGSVNGLTFLGENNKEYLTFPHPDSLSEDQLKALAFQVLYYLHDNEKITKLY